MTVLPLNTASIALLVDRFYDKVQKHPTLGPVFNPAVHDWTEHKETLVAFWSQVALGERGYNGSPMSAHQKHNTIRAAHFDDWLALWRETTREVLDEDGAAKMIDFAERIGRSLRYGLGIPMQGRGLGIPLVSVGK
ncbi:MULTISPECIES: group III truncated hemoglobin [Dyella]|uniref:Group III truncated hemoglobin n=2 Tax=Dyella TaxID=231454 RepID=A0A4R0YU48_9GAMM|nr:MULTISPECIES: group III truncated hemoglobin [Dyella]TBR40447.1 group III truncated hemoglobin [Dyella terrae]TCI11971.1 group III truncated hemoglobin [Dyella soli]